jgi:hypothetical protein
VARTRGTRIGARSGSRRAGIKQLSRLPGFPDASRECNRMSISMKN